MKIESIDKRSLIIIEFADCEIERFPTVSFSIIIHDRGFSGQNKHLWFELRLLKDFIKDLRQLEEKRKGAVSINSMSPEEFRLNIETYDLCGHMVICYKISQDVYIGTKAQTIS